MSVLRIWQASDLHLGAAGGPEREDRASEAWAEFARAVEEHRPELVVLTGDLVVDDPDDADDHRAARALIAALPVPTLVVPGNHDVGDHAVRRGLPADWHGKTVTAERVASWEAFWGPSWWVEQRGGRTIIGLNAQIVGSGLDAERRQLAWLRGIGDELIRGCEVIVFLHEALVPSRRAETEGTEADGHEDGQTRWDDSWMAVPSEAGEVLQSVLREAASLTIASGHTHRAYGAVVDGARHVSAPSLAGPIPHRADMEQAVGDEWIGWLEFRLPIDGGAPVRQPAVDGGATVIVGVEAGAGYVISTSMLGSASAAGLALSGG